MKYYKFLEKNGTASFSGIKYNLPKSNRPGKWMPYIAKLKECESGYHACRKQDLIWWLNHRLFVVQYEGEVIEYDDKVNGHQIRLLREIKIWNEVSARLFACDCLEHALPIYQKEHPNDDTIECCIYIARAFALGGYDKNDLAAAWEARNGMGDAAWEARNAAEAAAWEAREAVGAEAWEARENAEAAWEAEEKWQTKTLLKYLKLDDKP